MRSASRSTVILLTALLAGACRPAEDAAEAAPPAAETAAPAAAAAAAPPVVEVSGTDYAFEAPIEVDAGWTTFRFAAQGREPHHLTLIKLAPGKTAADLIAALRDRQPMGGIGVPVGGPNAPMPGASSNATVNLEAGEYALLCVIPSPDGMPHFMKGMVKPITVRPGASTATPPSAEIELTFRDYAFELSEPITAGLHTIRATTAADATEPHEVVIARLEPGKSVEDLGGWLSTMQGPPPATFLGGVTAMAPGVSNTFTVDFAPGDYVILCPIPSEKDGQEHHLKGMIHQFTVS